MPHNHINKTSTLVYAMAWCRYLSPCWPRSVSPYGVTRPEWGKPWRAVPVSILHPNSLQMFLHLASLQTQNVINTQCYWLHVYYVFYWHSWGIGRHSVSLKVYFGINDVDFKTCFKIAREFPRHCITWRANKTRTTNSWWYKTAQHLTLKCITS